MVIGMNMSDAFSIRCATFFLLPVCLLCFLYTRWKGPYVVVMVALRMGEQANISGS